MGKEEVKKLVAELKDWFLCYVTGYKSGSPEYQRNIIIKEQHSLRVAWEALCLARSLNLGPDGEALAEISGLLHDVGRFEQYARYKTFLDRISVDHAKLGVEILVQKNVLAPLPEKFRVLVLETIRSHNRLAPPPGLPADTLLHARILRDADKIDILRVMAGYYSRPDASANGTLVHGLPDTPGLSPSVLADLEAEHLVDAAGMSNLNDFKMLQACWIYDLNFPYAFQRFRERKYLQKIMGSLNAVENAGQIFEKLLDRLERMAETGECGPAGEPHAS